MSKVVDPIVEAVRADLRRRSELGIAKYGTTLAGNPLTHAQWLEHAYFEALDMALYLRRAMEPTEGVEPAGWHDLSNNR